MWMQALRGLIRMPVDSPKVKGRVTQFDLFSGWRNTQSLQACISRGFAALRQLTNQLITHGWRYLSVTISKKPAFFQWIRNTKCSGLQSKHCARPISFIFRAKIFTNVQTNLLTKLIYCSLTYPTEGSGRREAQPQRMRFGSALSYPLGWDTLLGSQDGALASWTLQPLAPGSSSHQSLRHGCGLNFILPLSHSTGS